MAEYLPFNSILDGNGNPDRAVKAEDWAWYFSTFIGDGVFPKPTTGLQVVADTGMDVTVKAGYGFIKGYAFRNSADTTKTIGTADGSLGRIDRVVLRWDLTNRIMVLDVLQGTPSASPAAPALTRTADKWELALADISVAAGITTITQSMITDRRSNTSLCGIVEGTVSQIDWATLTVQLDAFLEEYTAAVASDYAQYTEDIEGYEAAWKAALTEWEDDEQAAFEEWFQHVRDMLDEDVAANLQNQIDYLREQTGIPSAYDPNSSYAVGDYVINDNTLYRCMTAVSGGTFDTSKWDATTVLAEIEKAIARHKDAIFEEMAKGSLGIVSNLIINSSKDRLLLGNGNKLTVGQHIKFNFA